MSKKIGDHRVCLGDIAQNITKIGGFFLLIFRSEPGASFKNLSQIEQISLFPINLPIVNLTV